MKTYLKDTLKIFKITLTIVMFITLPLVVFTLVTSRTDKINGIQNFVVLTGSMEPTIPVGSLIFTQKATSYQKNDVISFKQGNLTVTHRVVGVVNNNGVSYKTKGDANKVSDTNLVPSKEVLGKSVFVALNIGKLILFMKTLPGFILTIILPIFIFMTFEILNIKKELEKEIRKKVLASL